MKTLTKALLYVSKEVGLGVNTKKTTYYIHVLSSGNKITIQGSDDVLLG
jgi:hypothetical protein